ncbi:unnamed protein product [Knipowitschia caucasica]
MQCLVHLLTIFPAIILAHLLPITCSTMALRYSSFQLHRLTHCLPPPSDIAASIKHAGLLRRPRYIHRGSRRKFIYNSTCENNISTIRSVIHSASAFSSARHQNARQVNIHNLRPISTSALTLSQQKPLKLSLLNTRSLNNKSHILNEFITDTQLDLLCITETWQKPLDYFSLNQATPQGFSYIDQPRTSGRGGGIAAIHRQSLKLKPLPIPAILSFEQLSFKLLSPSPLVISIIYRPPKPNPSFLSELSEFITHLCTVSSSILLLGDFNIHIDSAHNTVSTDFLDILQNFNFTQHVDFPTHSRGHILDLICSTGLHIDSLSHTDLAISDHLALTFHINIPNPHIKQTRTLSFRNLNSLCSTTLSNHLSQTLSTSEFTSPANTPDLVSYYNSTLSSCLDTLAPIKTASVTFTRSAPWYTTELRNLKKQRRQLERLHNKTGLTVHLQALNDHTLLYRSALSTTRTAFYTEMITSGSSNPRTLFSTVNKLLKPPDNITQSFTTEKCNIFLTFFKSKIDNIHQQLTKTPAPVIPDPSPRTVSPLSHLSPISEPDLQKLFTNIKFSTCPLDPIPSSFVKSCLPSLSPLILEIINSSLTSGTVPPAFKMATITPILKKPNLDPDDPNNFRPISNLPFLSKILEQSVAAQLNNHLNSNSLFDKFQSGFRSQHSTETALLKVINDLLLTSDSGSLSILLLLDLSAAFDTIDHSILLHRLQFTTGITGSALSWFSSYLSNRSHYIAINNCSSRCIPVTHGVPQGSVLGPLLFILYMLPLGHIIHQHGFNFHSYADDTQLYLSAKSITPATISSITNCISAIKSWMSTNFLQLNCKKSEIIIIGPKSLLSNTQHFTLSIDSHTISPSAQIRNLGIILDPTLSFKPHIRNITKTAFFHLKNIARLRPYLSSTAAETLIHAFISSRLDFCNSLLYGLPSSDLQKLQYVQNSAARLLTQTRSREHITPVLQKLHWLPVKQRIHFKILLIT